MRKLSWILLAVVGALTLLGSLASAYTAYSGAVPDEFGPGGPTVRDVAAWKPEVATAIRARRGTAAAYAAAYAALFLFIVLGPYRRGETWSWWALLAGTAVLAAMIAARAPWMGTRLGVGSGLTQFAVVLVALLIDVGRLRQARGPRP